MIMDPLAPLKPVRAIYCVWRRMGEGEVWENALLSYDLYPARQYIAADVFNWTAPVQFKISVEYIYEEVDYDKLEAS